MWCLTLRQGQFHRFLFFCFVLSCYVLWCDVPPFIKVNTIDSYSFVMYCYVMYCDVIYHPSSRSIPPLLILLLCLVMLCIVRSRTTLHHSQFHQVKVIRNSEVLLPNFLWLDPIWSWSNASGVSSLSSFFFIKEGHSHPSYGRRRAFQAIQATHPVASSNRWSRENTFCRRPRTSRLYSCRRKPRWPLPQTKSCVMWVKQWDFTMKSGDLMGSIMGFNRI